MTPKQQKFCLEYVASGNAADAAIKAGYSRRRAANAANRLNEKSIEKYRPDLAAYIEELNQEIESSKIATASEMQQVLTSIIRREAEEEVIVVEGRGEGVSEAVRVNKKPSHRDVISAIEKLCKMQGLYKTGDSRTDSSDDGVVIINDAPN